MIDRKLLLSRLTEGDIFHAKSPSAPSLICLVTSVSETIIQARTVTTQVHIQFDRQTGIGEYHVPVADSVCTHIAKMNLPRKGDGGPAFCTVDSVAPLPVEIHNVMLGLDRKYRLEYAPERFKLNDAEKRALIFVASHYPSNPL